MTIAGLLRDVRALIADPDRWAMGCAARDAQGQAVMPERPEAVRFSAFGAPVRLAPAAHEIRDRAAEALNAAVGPEGWNWWEDAPGRTHAEVLAALDRAIAAADIVAGLVRVGRKPVA